MIEINKNKLIPGVDTSWGDIRGDISKQSDLMSMMSSYVTEEWVSDKNYLTASGLKTINNQSIVGSGNINIEASVPDYYATKQWVSEQGYLTSETLPSDLATESWVSSQGYITSEALSGFATESWVSSQGYLVNDDLSQYATRQWVTGRGYITSDALSGYATESWVSGQGYLTSTSLKTINEQSLVGEGDIEIGGLTPEQEEAIEPLEETSGGVLYTCELAPLTSKYMINDIQNTEYNINIYNVGDDVYYNVYGQYLYKWNFDKLTFEKLCDFNGGYSPIWKDNSGRLYCGNTIQITDENTGTTESVDLNASEYYYQYNNDNIVHGQYGIYLIYSDCCKKFDEEDQEFQEYTINFPESFSSAAEFTTRLRDYEGHLVSVESDGYMYELVESEDHLDIVKVNNPYFPVYVNGSLIDMFLFHKCGGMYYYLDDDNHYKLSSGSWGSISINRPGWADMRFTYGGVDTPHYLIGYEAYSEEGNICITNPGSTSFKQTYWSEVKNVAVDISSSQIISGTKNFNNITVQGLQVGSLSPLYYESFVIGDAETTMTVYSKSIDAHTTSGIALLDNHNIATTDKCILNVSIDDVGPYFEVAVDEYTYSNRAYYFKAYNEYYNREYIYRNSNGSWYQFDGSSYVQVYFDVSPDSGEHVFTTADGWTIYIPEFNDGHVWDPATAEFNEANTFTNEFDTSQIWIAGNCLRYMDTYLLDNLGDGEFEWVEDSLSNWPGSGKSVKCGNNIYYFCEDGYVYQYTESNKTFIQLGAWLNDYIYNIFSFGTRLFFKFGGKVYEFLYNNAGTQNPMYRVTTIYSSTDNCQYFCELKDSYNHNHLYTVKDNKLGYVYDKTETVPAVPASNGTYVLQAVRLGDQITYSWVPAT